MVTNVPLPLLAPPSPPLPAPFVKLHRKAKGPNPLSIRKRKRVSEGNTNATEGNTNGSSADVQKRTFTRRGTRAGKSIKAKKLQSAEPKESPIVGALLVE